MKINVLGTEYELVTGVKEKDDPKLTDNVDGYCDFTTKRIVVAEMVEDDLTMKNLKYYEEKVIRHEIVHAFMYESGLDVMSDWGRDEQLIDWLAIQIPKMNNLFNELNI